MSPQPIIISAVDQMKHERHMARYQAYAGRRRPVNTARDSIIDMAIHGYAVLYGEPLPVNGLTNIVEPGALTPSINGADPIYLQLDHDPEMQMASTLDALSFADDNIGLAFHIDLEETRNGPTLKQMVDSGQRACVSVGLDIIEDRVEKSGGQTIRYITKATLREISLCQDGACKDAFASTVNGKHSPKVATGKKGVVFTMNFVAHKLRRLNQTADARRDQILSVASKLDRVERNTLKPVDAPPDISSHYRFYP